MTLASNNEFPSILVKEGTAPASPAAGDQRLYIDSTAHQLRLVNSSGVVGYSVSGFHGVKAYSAATQTINNTSAAVALELEEFDSDAYHDLVTNNSRITIPAGLGGKYLLAGGVAPNGSGFDWVGFKLNGTTNLRGFASNEKTAAAYAQCTITVALSAGDYVEMWAATTANISIGSVSGTANQSWFSATFLGA